MHVYVPDLAIGGFIGTVVLFWVFMQHSFELPGKAFWQPILAGQLVGVAVTLLTWLLNPAGPEFATRLTMFGYQAFGNLFMTVSATLAALYFQKYDPPRGK